MNASNGSVPLCPVVYDGSAAKIIKMVALSLLMVFALVLNSLVIAVFAKTPSLQRTVNYFLVNMAASDLLVAIAAIPKEILDLSSGSSHWRVGGDFGHVLCILQSLLVDISYLVSILSMTCITIDRFCAVMMPLRVTLVPGKVRGIIILLTWVLSVVNYCYYFYTLRLDIDEQGDIFCILSFPFHNTKISSILVTYIFVLYGCVPWILVAFLYTAMVIGLKRARISIEANDQNNVRGNRSTSVTRQAFVIVLLFSICFFPFNAMFLVIAHVYHFTCSPLPYFGHLFFAAQFLTFSNAALNPCVCLFLCENYRNGLWKILRLNNLQRVYPGIAMEEVREEPVTRVT